MGAAVQGRESLAFLILRGSMGQERADELWSGWTDDERAPLIALADEAFRPVLETLAADIVMWHERGLT